MIKNFMNDKMVNEMLNRFVTEHPDCVKQNKEDDSETGKGKGIGKKSTTVAGNKGEVAEKPKENSDKDGQKEKDDGQTKNDEDSEPMDESAAGSANPNESSEYESAEGEKTITLSDSEDEKNNLE